MRTRARSTVAGAFLALALSLLLAAPSPARAAGVADLDVASPGSPEEPAMCPAKNEREAERQIFGVRQQLAAQLPPQPADPGFQVLNTQGANYPSGQRIADPAILHLEGALRR